MAAVDVSGLVSGVTGYAVPIGAVGAGFLLLHLMTRALQWLKLFFGLDAESRAEADFWRKYETGEALEGADFITDKPQSFSAFRAGGNAASESGGSFHTMTVNGEERSVWIDASESAASDAEDAADQARWAAEDQQPLDLTVKLGGGWK